VRVFVKDKAKKASAKKAFDSFMQKVGNLITLLPPLTG